MSHANETPFDIDEPWASDEPFIHLPDTRYRAEPLKGRGTATALPHRFNRLNRQLDVAEVSCCTGESGEGGDEAFEREGVPITSVVHEQARSILTRNDSPDIPFTWSLNPYRGCEHGCIYCYARPTHSYLNLSPGLDFETKLVAKVNAAALLRQALAKPSYSPSPVCIGSATDAYQPIERELRITREVIEVLLAHRHPYTIVTKSSGIERDIDLLAQSASRQQVYVMVSLTTLDGALCRKLEPRAAAPHRRLLTVERLARAGVPVGVNVAPIIPFLNEPEIERLIEAAAQAGACSLHYTVVRLPWEVSPLFQEWLSHHVPDRAGRIMARIRDMRGGANYDATYTHRMKGQGIWADLIRQRVQRAKLQHGLTAAAPSLDTAAFQRPTAINKLMADPAEQQLPLF